MVGLATRASAKYHNENYIDDEISIWFEKCTDWMKRKLEEVLFF